MTSEDPEEPPKYETHQKIAVNGEIVGELKVKPDALRSDIEDNAFLTVLAAQFGEIAQDGEEDIETLKEYDPEIQIWTNEDDGESSWSPPRNISETQFVDVYEDL